MLGGPLVLTTCALTALAIATAGCGSGECGLGTVRYGATCLAVDPFDTEAPRVAVDPPLHTRAVGLVRLVADEPAFIYYTIDGSQPTLESANEPDQVVITDVPDDAQLRYFAVDLAGNQSDEESRFWIIDREGPGAPLDFRVTLAGATRTVTWTPPPDPRPGGVLAARVEGPLTAPPQSGQRYAVGDTLSPGVTVVEILDADATGTATFTESMPATPGLVRYVAWAFDNLHNYGPPAGDYQLVPVPAQTGRIAINAGTGAVSVVSAPSHVTLAGTATLVGATLTLRLSVRNDTTRTLFAPKLLLTSALAGVTWTNADGDLDTAPAPTPYRAYGAALKPGTTALEPWVFTGASASTTLTLDLALQDGYVLTATSKDQVSSGAMVDPLTGQAVLGLDTGPTGQGGAAMTQRGGITPDGHLIVGARTAGTVSSFDLATGFRLLTTTLRPQKSHVPQVILDRSGSAAYALVAEGHPRSVNSSGGAGSETTLVRLVTATLTENGRLSLGVSRNRDINLSPDGKTLIVASGNVTNGVIVIDLASFQIARRILPGFRPQCALFTPDGAQIVVVGEETAIYSAADGTRAVAYPTPGTNGKVVRATFGAGGKLWIGRRDELARLDLTTGVGEVFTGFSGRMLDVFEDKVFVGNGSTMTRLDADGVAETTLPGFTRLDGHWIGRSPF